MPDSSSDTDVQAAERESQEKLLDRIAGLEAECEHLRQSSRQEHSGELAAVPDEWLHLIADRIPQIVWTTDPEGFVDYFNHLYTLYTGSQLEPRSARDTAAAHIDPEDVPATLAAFEGALRTGEPYRVEHRLLSRTGEYRWFLARAEPHRDPETGAIVRWFGTSTDIHDQKMAESALRESEARFRVLADLSPDAMLVVVDGRYAYANMAAARLFGVTDAQEIVGRTPFDFVDPERHEAMRERLRILEQGGTVPVTASRIRRVHGPSVDVEFVSGAITWQGKPAVQVVLRDVTEHTRLLAEAEAAREAAEAAERQLQTVFAQAPALVAVTGGPEHRFVLANPGFEEIVSRGDLVGRTVREVLPELEAQGIFALFDRVYATGEPYVANEQRVLLPRDGAEPYEGWYNFVYQPLTDASGAITGILQHAIEVTAQVRARQAIEAARTAAERTASALAQSESKLRFALAVAELGAWDLDLTTHQAWRDPRHDQIFGYAELLPEWTYEMFLEHVVPEDRERVAASFGTALGAGTAWDFTCRIRRADGAERWILARGEPITDAAGTPVRLIGIVRDITAEREAEAALRVSEGRLRALVTASSYVLYRMSPDWSEMRQLDGQGFLADAESPTDAWLGEYIHPDDQPQVLAAIHAAVRTKSTFDLEHRVRRADGTLGWTLSRAVPLLDANGEITEWFGAASDVTARKEAEAERERLLVESEAARAEAEAANRAKSEFLAVMSHELRTPLNAIGGYTELMELGIHGPITDAQRAALDRIQRSQRHLLGLINEVLNYARLESGAVRYEIEDVRVREEFAAAEALISPQVRAEELTLTVEDCPENLAMRADPEKLRQILINLLSNAAKFTDAGGRIELGCDVRAERVHVWVRDTGIGIPPDKLEAIFDPFVQVRSDLTRIHQGTGLGLAISRDLARGMGGDLTAESNPGEGSTFTLHLPRSAAGAS